MAYVNENYLNLNKSYFFSQISRKIADYQKENPDASIVKLGIGDVTRPIVKSVIGAMHKAVDEMSDAKTFKGYGPEQGYKFLVERILDVDYMSRGVELDTDEIFVSDGAKSDTGNIGDILGVQNVIGVTNPVYPVYVDTNVMAGRKIVFIPCDESNGFVPELPSEKIDVLYLCLPNNPTGITLNREQLKKWVDFAKKNNILILFDSAYEAFITEKDVPHSIYEIEGAKDVAIEFRSFSKTAGFTGLRCGYAVVPKLLKGYTASGDEVCLNELWNRRHTTKFNGASYIIQRGAEAVYSEDGQREIKENIAYYMQNAKIIRDGLIDMGFEVFGGVNAPYIWLKTPNDMKSWDFFDKLLSEANVAGTPGVGFGEMGEGYFRLTAFGTRENTVEALKRIKERLK